MSELTSTIVVFVFVFNVPPTARVIWRRDHGLVSSDRLVKPEIEPATPGLQGKCKGNNLRHSIDVLNT